MTGGPSPYRPYAATDHTPPGQTGGVFLFVKSFTFFLFPNYDFPNYDATISLVVLAPAAIAELSLCLWLLLKGVKVQP